VTASTVDACTEFFASPKWGNHAPRFGTSRAYADGRRHRQRRPARTPDRPLPVSVACKNNGASFARTPRLGGSRPSSQYEVGQSMPSLKIPRLEALLFCDRVAVDEGRTYHLAGVANQLTWIGQPPFVVKGTVFVKFAASPGVHTSEVHVRRIDTGEIIARTPPAPDNATVSESTGVSIGTVPVDLLIDSAGAFALQLVLDGKLIGESVLHVAHVPRGSLG
jgi:hypothetical protein